MLNKLLNVIACPECKQKVMEKNGSLFCKSCGIVYSIINDVPIMLFPQGKKNIERHLQTEEGLTMEKNYTVSNYFRRKSFLSKVKSFLSPPSSTWHIHYIEKIKKQKIRNIDKAWEGDLIVNVGGGPLRNNPKEINLNIGLYPNVDIVGDAHQLPFLNESIDSIISAAVIEHLADPCGSVAEIYRVLKPGGAVYVEVPFLQHFHGCPGDYQRYTLMGIRNLFSAFKEVDCGICVGPSSALVQFLIDYIHLLIPVKSSLFNYMIRWIISPLKFFDLFLINRTDAHKIASGCYFCGIKQKKL